jgi:hypothetical protein
MIELQHQAGTDEPTYHLRYPIRQNLAFGETTEKASASVTAGLACVPETAPVT